MLVEGSTHSAGIRSVVCEFGRSAANLCRYALIGCLMHVQIVLDEVIAKLCSGSESLLTVLSPSSDLLLRELTSMQPSACACSVLFVCSPSDRPHFMQVMKLSSSIRERFQRTRRAAMKTAAQGLSHPQAARTVASCSGTPPPEIDCSRASGCSAHTLASSITPTFSYADNASLSCSSSSSADTELDALSAENTALRCAQLLFRVPVFFIILS